MNNSGRLRYADPKDLPYFPTVGLKDNDAATSAAASLGWANQKQFEHWKPGATSSSASTAAMLAKDYKTGPGWQPEPNSAGAQAAILAAGSAKAATNGSSNRREATDSTTHRAPAQPSPAAAASASMSTWGNSAANLAFKSNPARQPSQAAAAASSAAPRSVVSGTSTVEKSSLDRQKSLRAAKGAMAASTNRARPRAKSTPTAPQTPSYPDQANAAANALSAATSAHRPTNSTHRPTPSAGEAGAIPFTTMNRQMFTSHPPVKPEVDEQRRADVIHASAVAMAKRMYNQQQRAIDATKKSQAAAAASATSGARAESVASSDTGSQPQPYVNLQEAAYKLAQERLAKLHEEHQRGRDINEYYGVGAGNSMSSGQAPSNPPVKRGLTMRNKLRRRASSDGDVIEDRRKSEQIRQQMSNFSTRLSEVDAQKRQRDRDAVLAAAQRNVRAQLEGMDRKIAGDTGRQAPNTVNEWNLKAHAAALNQSEARGAREGVNAGKIDIGGGKWIDPKDVEEVAARRVQPVLDEINEKAEKERERQLALKMEEEKRKEDEEKRKAREREVNDIHQKLKQEQKDKERAIKEEVKREEKIRKDAEKAAKAEQKEEIKQEKHARKEAEKASKAEEKAAKAEVEAEQKRQADEAKNKGKEPVVASPTSPSARRASTSAADEPESTQRRVFPAFEHTPHNLQTKSKSDTEKSPKSPSGDEPTSPNSKSLKTWLKSRFSRPRAKTAEQQPTSSPAAEGGFIGGHTLHRRNADSLSSLDQSRSASMREVAMAGRSQPAAHQSSGLIGRSGVDSSVSSLSSDDEFESVRGDESRVSGTLSPPPALKGLEDPGRKVSGSPARDSRFLENLDSP